MAKKLALRIKVEIVETEVEPSSDRCPHEQGDGAFRLVLPEADELKISALARAALDVSFPALREALSRHWAQAGKKLHRQAEQLKAELAWREHADGYQVAGESGRFSVALYEAVDAMGTVVWRGATAFPQRQPREWHQTEGCRDEALCLDASKRSYRDTTAPLTRYRRQVQGGTPVTPLPAKAQQEGAQVLAVLERHSQTVLPQHGFEAQGHPSQAAVAAVVAGRDRRLTAAPVEASLTAGCQEMAAHGLTPPQVAAARNRAVQAVYEVPAQCVTVAVDDVQVKQQKAHRQHRAPPTAAVIAPVETAAPAATPAGDRSPTPGASSVRSRPKVANTVARIEQGAENCFTLSGRHLGPVLRFVLAFLLSNDLLAGRVHFFTDGYKRLQQTSRACFAWHPRVWLLLDGYHLVKQFQEDLSLACCGRTLGNQHLRVLVRYWWYGWVTEAQQYLTRIPAHELKDAVPIERLQQYLDRNQNAIPCYALRRRLGLRHGSSPVESANNEVTARRQKHHGMRWSKAGSQALTALSVLVCNRCQAIWVREHTIPLRLVNKAA